MIQWCMGEWWFVMLMSLLWLVQASGSVWVCGLSR